MVDDLHPPIEVDIEDALDFGDAETDEEQNNTATGVEETRADELVSALNFLISKEPEILKVDFEFQRDRQKQEFDRFWLCSFVHPAGPIDFTQGASKRASDWLLLVGIFWIYKKEEGLSKDDFQTLLDRIEHAETGIDVKLSQCIKRLYASDQSVASRILKSRDIEDTDEQEFAFQEVFVRAKWLWSRLFA